MVLLIGVQASGKTSFYQRFFAGTHVHVSKDLWKHNKRHKQQKAVTEALQAGQHVVIDNTNPTRTERALLIEMGQQAGARIVGYYFQSRLEDCLKRNQGRERVVPEVGVRATHSKLELPTLQEGFDRLFYVQLQDGDFQVSKWQVSEGEEP